MTSQHYTGTHPFYIGMYIQTYTHIYVHIYTSQKECLCIFFVAATSRQGLLSFWCTLVKCALQIFGSVNVFSYPFMSFLFISYHSYNLMSFDAISHHLISFHVTSCHFMSFHIISFHFVSISLTSSSLMEPWETILFDLCEAHNVTIAPLASICTWNILGGFIGTFQ